MLKLTPRHGVTFGALAVLMWGVACGGQRVDAHPDPDTGPGDVSAETPSDAEDGQEPEPSARGYRVPQPEPLHGDKSAWRVSWSFFANGDELSDVTWSPKGDEIALVRRVHWPDGGTAHNYTREQLNMLSARAKVEPRFQDPRVVIIGVGGENSREIDYGRAPTFSPDGQKLAYVRQTNPQTGLRAMVPATANGNTIAVSELGSNKSTVWAAPKPEHQFVRPRWIDDSTLLIADCTPTWGSTLSCPGFLRVLGRNKVEEVGEAPAATVAEVATDARAIYEWRKLWQAPSLLRVGADGVLRLAHIKPVFEASRGWFRITYPVGFDRRRAVVISGRSWMTVDLASGKVSTGGRAPIPTEFDSPVVFGSPDAAWVLFAEAWRRPDGVYIARTMSKRATRIWSGPGVLQEARWSPDGRRVAWIVARAGSKDPETHFAGDEVIVLEFPRKPDKKEVPAYNWTTWW